MSNAGVSQGVFDQLTARYDIAVGESEDSGTAGQALMSNGVRGRHAIVQPPTILRDGTTGQALVVAETQRLVVHPRLDLRATDRALDQADRDILQPFRCAGVNQLGTKVHARRTELRKG